MRRFFALMPLWAFLVVAVTSTAVVSCGDDDEKPVTDAGDVGPDLDVSDEDIPDVSPPVLTVEYAWSQDGNEVGIWFEDDVDPTTGADPENYSLVASDDSVAVVSSAAVDGTFVVLEPEEPLDSNLTWELEVSGVLSADGESATDGATTPVMGTVYLNLIWHQHQPSYLNPQLDELQGPWVRKHATKDYFDMTAILRQYPDIHFNMNLTSSLLLQLQLYIERLGPFVTFDDEAGIWQVDEEGFLAEWEGHTDPWIDVLLNDTPDPAEATDEQLDRYYQGDWSLRSISEPLRTFFPEYEALLDKFSDDEEYTRLDLLYLKLFFEIAWMDPDFLNGPVVVYVDDEGDHVVVDLSDIVVLGDDNTYMLDPYYTTDAGSDDERFTRGELLANRLAALNYHIMVGTFEIHRELLFRSGEGQVEVLTTPFFHPILPLLYDTDLAAEGQPTDPLPSPPFEYPGDAMTQVAMAVLFYSRTFGSTPRGMWPSEGAVAEEIIPAFRNNNVDWIATAEHVLNRGRPDSSYLVPYLIDVDSVAGNGGDSSDEMMIVFRDTPLSDKISFHYKENLPEESAQDFLAEVLNVAAPFGEPSHLLTVIADGENAWEWFTRDHDAKGFHHALYTHLEQAYELGMIITVTGSEFIDGNSERGIEAHPISEFDEYEDLFPGSWIYGTLDTWIGEMEENLAWTYLIRARGDLAQAASVIGDDIELTSLLDPPSEDHVAEYNWWMTWRSMYAAEGSDWFWWFGSDQTAAGGDRPFDQLYRAQLGAMYAFMNTALEASGHDPVDVPAFPPVIPPQPTRMDGPFTTAPTLDGTFSPDETEWLPPAGAFWDVDSTADEVDPDDDIKRVLFGYDEAGTIYIGLEFNEDVSAVGTHYRVAIYTSHQNIAGDPPTVTGDPANTTTEEGLTVNFRAGGTARQILTDFVGDTPTVSLAEADGSEGWDDAGSHAIVLGGPIPGGTLLEYGIPLSDLGMSLGDPFEFIVVVSDDQGVVDFAPNIGSQVVFADPTSMVTVVFELDVTGDEIAIDTYVNIANPPPPDGTGQASIVGNQEDLANWTPCAVFMSDDGEDPDTTAGDNIWTREFLFAPGLDLQYKYNIGTSDDEGSWVGTEEFPLTNRGYMVPTDGTRRVRIRDVFADRPEPSGSMADMTTVTVEE